MFEQLPPHEKKGSRTRYTRAGIWREMKVEIFTILFPSRERGGPQQLASILRNPTPSCTIWRQPLRHPIPSPLSFSFRNIHFFLRRRDITTRQFATTRGGRTWLRCAMAATAAEIKLLITVTIRPRGGGEESGEETGFAVLFRTCCALVRHLDRSPLSRYCFHGKQHSLLGRQLTSEQDCWLDVPFRDWSKLLAWVD